MLLTLQVEFVSLVIKCQPMSPLLEDASNGHAAPLGPLMCTHSDTGSQTYSNFQGHGGFCFGNVHLIRLPHTSETLYIFAQLDGGSSKHYAMKEHATVLLHAPGSWHTSLQKIIKSCSASGWRL